MSFSLAFTADARAGLEQLDLLLQEDVLDAIDEIARRPTMIKRQSAGGTVVHDIVCERNGIRHYVFVTVRLGVQMERLDVLEIGHHSRTLGA
ncbi:MAG: hypothetical protein JWO87_559 [Phycisphaerales bacterium]|nr:hypothetical protein [Phycisphaerales bacterium]